MAMRGFMLFSWYGFSRNPTTQNRREREDRGRDEQRLVSRVFSLAL
jgi:hypothetical protein